jgi:hypothetical protein
MAQPRADGSAVRRSTKCVPRDAWQVLRERQQQGPAMSSSNENQDENNSQEQYGKSEPGDNGHSGEGAASALAHMISQGQQHRHQTGEADDAAGGRRQ